MNITQEVLALGLPANSYMVVGSSVLAVHDIREAEDIDMIVSAAVFAQLKEKGWREEEGADEKVLRHGLFDIGQFWAGKTVDELLPSATLIDGVPFLSLADLRQWKEEHARPKDLQDIRLIDAYLDSHC